MGVRITFLYRAIFSPSLQFSRARNMLNSRCFWLAAREINGEFSSHLKPFGIALRRFVTYLLCDTCTQLLSST